MTKVNTTATGHGNSVDLGIQYNAFPNTTAIDNQRLIKVTHAYNIANNIYTKINL